MSEDFSPEQADLVQGIERRIAACPDRGAAVVLVSTICLEYLRSSPDYILSLIHLYLPLAVRENLLIPRARLLFSLGRIQVDRHEFDRAQGPLEEAKGIFERLGLQDQAIRCQISLADALHQRGLNNSALAELWRILERCRASGLPEAVVQGNIGANYNDLEQWCLARRHLELALKDPNDTRINKAINQYHLAYAWLWIFPPLGWFHLNKAIPLLEEYSIMPARILLAKALLAYHWSRSKACALALKAYRAASTGKNDNQRATILSTLVRWYLMNGKYYLAASHAPELRRLMDQTVNQRLALGIAHILEKLSTSPCSLPFHENWSALIQLLTERLRHQDPPQDAAGINRV